MTRPAQNVALPLRLKRMRKLDDLVHCQKYVLIGAFGVRQKMRNPEAVGIGVHQSRALLKQFHQIFTQIAFQLLITSLKVSTLRSKRFLAYNITKANQLTGKLYQQNERSSLFKQPFYCALKGSVRRDFYLINLQIVYV